MFATMERFSSKWSHPIWYPPGKNNRVPAVIFMRYRLMLKLGAAKMASVIVVKFPIRLVLQPDRSLASCHHGQST